MPHPEADKLYYVRLPGAQGGRAEMVRLVYVLAGKPYVDVVAPMAEAAVAVVGKNPFKQFPYVETPTGASVYQAMATRLSLAAADAPLTGHALISHLSGLRIFEGNQRPFSNLITAISRIS